MKQLVVLFASMSGDPRAKADIDSLFQLFEMKKLQYVTVDGADPVNKDMRNLFFEKSGLRAKYPQVFFRTSGSPSAPPSTSDSYEFVGDFDSIRHMNEVNEVNNNFDNVFGTVSTPTVSSKALSAPAPAPAPAAATPSRTMAPPPPLTANDEKDENGNIKKYGADSAAAKAGLPPKDSWKRVDKDGETFWWNRVSKQSAWVNPLGEDNTGNGVIGSLVPFVDPASGKTFYYDWLSGSSQWLPPKPDGPDAKVSADAGYPPRK